ncbi:MAG: hypothetical protein J3R72DRAFT_456062 [Linnemannia gamsii]|nr:MAG: hypothetical protein J3R72DRAFT_456062 [Linnemannia gamsii]
MSILQLKCITTDPDETTFYGFAFAYINSRAGGYSDINAVLVNSNTNPSSPKLLDWAMVSTINTNEITTDLMGTYPLQPYLEADYSCAMNAHGVFTVFGKKNSDMARLGDTTNGYGLQYDPAGIAAPGSTKGPGAWTGIKVDKAYNWTIDYRVQTLGYVSNVVNGAGPVLVHSFVSNSSNTVHLATVDDATKTLNAAGTWLLSRITYGVPKALKIFNDHLYTFGDLNLTQEDPSYLTGFPLATIGQGHTPLPPGKIFNTTTTFKCSWSPSPYLATNQGSLVLVCDHSLSNIPSSSYLTKSLQAQLARLRNLKSHEHQGCSNWLAPCSLSKV